ncbi:MAG TPA: cytochrome c, partial [Gemmatimonadaceae bacterium]
YIFGMIRNGRGLMPPYNRIEEMDRWDVVNYVRALQGVGGKTVAIGPLAAPGVTGDKVPGATTLAPQQPEPFYNPRSVLPGAQQSQPQPPQVAPVGSVPGQRALPLPAASDTSRSRPDSAVRTRPNR